MKALLDPHAVDEETAAEVEGSVQEGKGSGDLNDTPFCIPCEGNVCFCEDKRKVTFFPTILGAFSTLGPAAHVSTKYCSMRQACCVSRPDGNTSMTGTQDQPMQQPLGSCGAVVESCTIGQGQLQPCTTGSTRGQLYKCQPSSTSTECENIHWEGKKQMT